MGKDKKRKRDSNVEDESGQPPAKSQALENGNSAAKSEPVKKKGNVRRQIRSERKKKRELQAQQGALRKRADQAAAAAEAALGLDAGTQATTQDDIAAGQDFVSLPVETKRVLKEKRKSPRSIRKAARQLAQDNAKKDNPDETAENRFICFVGNLPFTATSEQVMAHFSKLQPKAFRMNTDKRTGKSKGFGFVEFESYDKMKTCLKLYHHSIFDPEGQDKDDTNEIDEASASRGRKINVELTAGGGGGKSESRKEKIKTKNKKLHQERARDRKKKLQQEGGKNKQDRSGRDDAQTSGGKPEQIDGSVEGAQNDIHPSRRSRVRM